MEATVLLQQCQWALQQAIQLGNTPTMYVMNAATRKCLGDGIIAAALIKKSRLQKLFGKKENPTINSIFGVPIFENQHYADAVITLQWIPNGQFQNAHSGLNRATSVTPPAPGAAQPAPAEDNPFVRREIVPQAQAACPDKAPSLDDLAATAQSGNPSVSDVLIKAMERAESLAQVVVLRKFHNGDVDCSMSCNPDEAVGIVQKAQIWLAHNGH